MKKIAKAAPPDDLNRWRADNAAIPQNLVYGQAQFPQASVLAALLQEQGYLCGYTLKRLSVTSAHVEHIKPQTLCRREDGERECNGRARLREDIDWRNLLACFPEPNPATPPDYGAVKKRDWWQPDFVSPLLEDCEQRFLFASTGGVSARANDGAADATIKALALDNKKLSELRETAFKRAGVHRRAGKPITSTAKVEQLIAGWMNKQRASGTYAEFCVPLVQIAKEYAQLLRRTETVA